MGNRGLEDNAGRLCSVQSLWIANGVVLEDKYSSQKWQVTLAGFPTSSLFFFFFPSPVVYSSLSLWWRFGQTYGWGMGNKRGGYENKVTPDTSCTLHYPPIFF